ncbi:NAD(P)H-binding protein [Sphingomonas sp. CL5.1]|uniref:NAD(P)H-binding protein n=1 Tax=Sphingomonas sp. CL5.1 TaxID=2653203 RepID=UPI00158255E5|nr:NAD(P)H-binding protein [Sphingomonas sp. CL5.1]QKR99312.1 NAD(P)H-binding protein [Sphingomonas sp. CL5.1]
MKLLLVGATGLVGHEVLTQALEHPRVESVIALTRRPLTVAHRKLTAPVVRFDDLPEDAGWWQANAAICTLGTTIGKAGSREAFREVDHDYPLAVARLARAHGTQRFAIVSAMGANPNSVFFYSRVKGELEADLATLGFPSLTLVRPGLIGGDRAERRAGEQAAALALNLFGPVLPKAWRINSGSRIAEVLLDAALGDGTGIKIIGSAQMA